MASPPQERPSIADIQERLAPLIGAPQIVPKTHNKGGAGHALETLLGIPHSSSCLDCADGELKAFPLKRLQLGQLVPKETVCITMCDPEKLKKQPFRESRCCAKLVRTLFVPYLREEEHITFYQPFFFIQDHPLFAALETDYNQLQTKANDGMMTGSSGLYLQTRTKGQGHGSTSRAFYVRPSFLTQLFPSFSDARR